MMISLEISPDSMRLLEAHGRAAANVVAICAAALRDAGAEAVTQISAKLVRGELGLKARYQDVGLASSVQTWAIDETIPMIGVGVPANQPAAAYAAIHEEGGTIRPTTARALIVPLNDEARQALHRDPWSPANRLRQIMPDLVFIARPGRAPILARKAGADLIPMFALLKSVTIPARRWLSRGMAEAADGMVRAMDATINAAVAGGQGGQ